MITPSLITILLATYTQTFLDTKFILKAVQVMYIHTYIHTYIVAIQLILSHNGCILDYRTSRIAIAIEHLLCMNIDNSHIAEGYQ